MPTARTELSIALCQLTSVDDVAVNLANILKMIEELAEEGLDLICLPENALYLRVREGEEIPYLTIQDTAIEALAAWVRSAGVALHVGSVPLREGGATYNASLWITPEDGVLVPYRKIHLFDVDVEGHKPVRESDSFRHGSGPSVIDWRGWKFGSSICYDLRFSELYAHYAKAEVDAILIPSAFLVPTGQVHWDILVRARAIESQAYVLAAAQGGTHLGVDGGQRRTYGHSMAVDPWGVVLSECRGDGASIARARLTKARLAAVRAQIPMHRHRRL